jgi:gliotoxin/aspirochlorine biosynthesis thioredoxin reductase
MLYLLGITGNPGQAGFELYSPVTVENAEVATLKWLDIGLFEVAISDGKTWIGRNVILATGVEDISRGIPGYAECWISGM